MRMLSQTAFLPRIGKQAGWNLPVSIRNTMNVPNKNFFRATSAEIHGTEDSRSPIFSMMSIGGYIGEDANYAKRQGKKKTKRASKQAGKPKQQDNEAGKSTNEDRKDRRREEKLSKDSSSRTKDARPQQISAL